MSEEKREIQRYETSPVSAKLIRPATDGPYVRYEDHLAALQGARAERDDFAQELAEERVRAETALSALLEIRDTPVSGAEVEWIAWAREIAAICLPRQPEPKEAEEVEPGWLNRSLARAHENILQRPAHLKPARYRDPSNLASPEPDASSEANSCGSSDGIAPDVLEAAETRGSIVYVCSECNSLWVDNRDEDDGALLPGAEWPAPECGPCGTTMTRIGLAAELLATQQPNQLAEDAIREFEKRAEAKFLERADDHHEAHEQREREEADEAWGFEQRSKGEAE